MGTIEVRRATHLRFRPVFFLAVFFLAFFETFFLFVFLFVFFFSSPILLLVEPA